MDKRKQALSALLGLMIATGILPLIFQMQQQAYGFHIDDDAPGGGVGVLTTKFFVNGKLADWSETIHKDRYYPSQWYAPFTAVQENEPLEEIRLQAFIRIDRASEHGFEKFDAISIRRAEPKAYIYINSDPRSFGVPWNIEKSWFIHQVPGFQNAIREGEQVMLFDVVWTPKQLLDGASGCRTLQSSCQRLQTNLGFAVFADVYMQYRVVTGSVLGVPTSTFTAASVDSSASYSVNTVPHNNTLYTKVSDLLAEVPSVDETCNLIVSLFGQCGPDQTPIPISTRDTDNDGLINTIDPDIDNDGTNNESDQDIDGDGLPNGLDTTPTGQLDTPQGSGNTVDTDQDGQPNIRDNDIDGDGKLNEVDQDVDGDGKLNSSDQDIDGDGLNNVDDPDIDGDGTTNSNDHNDIDSDGSTNDQDSDMDGDGAPNRQDHDMDGDGTINEFDPDVDGDGVLNGSDGDIDGDGVDNARDSDADGDNKENTVDTTPNGAEPTERNLGNQFGENTMIVYGSIAGIVGLVAAGGAWAYKRRK